jgi:hypothetical protein
MIPSVPLLSLPCLVHTQTEHLILVACSARNVLKLLPPPSTGSKFLRYVLSSIRATCHLGWVSRLCDFSLVLCRWGVLSLHWCVGRCDSYVSLSAHSHLVDLGYGGVIVYQMRNLKPIPTPPKYITPKLQDRNHIVVASAFVYFESTRRHVLVLGTLDGDLIAWNWNSSKRVSNVSSVVSVSPFQTNFVDLRALGSCRTQHLRQ